MVGRLSRFLLVKQDSIVGWFLQEYQQSYFSLLNCIVAHYFGCFSQRLPSRFASRISQHQKPLRWVPWAARMRSKRKKNPKLHSQRMCPKPFFFSHLNFRILAKIRIRKEVWEKTPHLWEFVRSTCRSSWAGESHHGDVKSTEEIQSMNTWELCISTM